MEIRNAQYAALQSLYQQMRQQVAASGPTNIQDQNGDPLTNGRTDPISAADLHASFISFLQYLCELKQERDEAKRRLLKGVEDQLNELSNEIEASKTVLLSLIQCKTDQVDALKVKLDVLNHWSAELHHLELELDALKARHLNNDLGSSGPEPLTEVSVDATTTRLQEFYQGYNHIIAEAAQIRALLPKGPWHWHALFLLIVVCAGFILSLAPASVHNVHRPSSSPSIRGVEHNEIERGAEVPYYSRGDGYMIAPL